MLHRTKTVGVVMGGLSAEREISLRTGRGVFEALLARGYRAVAIDWQRREEIFTALQHNHVEVVWNALHGIFGEDGCLQGALECLGIPYTGSGVMGSAIALDKVTSKRIFDRVGIPTANWRIYRGEEDIAAIGFPLVVKPSQEGSSVGVAIVRSIGDLQAAITEARRYPGEVLVEEYVAGRELSVGILEERALGIAEVRPATEFYDYQAKYQRGDTQYLCPAALSPIEEAELGRLAEAAHAALGCAGYSRVDFILDPSGRAVCLEVNTLPGMTDKSLLPKIAATRGIDYASLVEKILDRAALHTRPSGEK